MGATNSKSPENEVRLCLIGKTGSGKSATGNSLLGKDVLEENLTAKSCTKRCTPEMFRRYGFKVVIVDSPGVFDTDIPEEDLNNEIRKCVYMTSPGADAFLFCIKIGRFTEEDSNTINAYASIFGENIFNYVIIVFTGADHLDDRKNTLESFLAEVPDGLKALIAKCGNRVIAFDNKAKKKKNDAQCQKLLEMVMAAREGKEHPYFTHQMYEQAEQKMKEELDRRLGPDRTEKKELKERDNIRKEIYEDGPVWKAWSYAASKAGEFAGGLFSLGVRATGAALNQLNRYLPLGGNSDKSCTGQRPTKYRSDLSMIKTVSLEVGHQAVEPLFMDRNS